MTTQAQDVILALDVAQAEDAFRLLDSFKEQKPFVKVGMELYYAAGPKLVYDLHERGHKIFLDLKLHDIPHTVSRALQALRHLPVDIIDVHAGGGSAMLKAAAEAVEHFESRPKLIGVTMLTSLDQRAVQEELHNPHSIEYLVGEYARLAEQSGLSGVVCSPWEVGHIRDVCSPNFITVTPGIRFAGDQVGDQARITTPDRAAELGSSYIVMGRSLTQAPDPAIAYAYARALFTGKE